MKHIVHLWDDGIVWVKTLELGVVDLKEEAEICNNEIIAGGSKNVIHYVHQKKEIPPVIIVLWYQVSHQKGKIPCQTPHL